ncbi:MAG TPA: PAS domain-containing protein, partial [Gemmatimonadales bacterium]|nr:PAS domain-containing protein [Gemmatimonadales bacterium]
MAETDTDLRARLAELQERLALVQAATGVGIWEWDVASNRVTWSPECYAILGTDQLEHTIDGFLSVVHPDDLGPLMAASEAALAGDGRLHHTFRIRRPDGSPRWLVNHARASFDRNGRPLHLRGTVQDITGIRQESRPADGPEQALNALIDRLPDCAWIATAEGACRHVNQAGREYFGLDGRDVALRWVDLVHPEDRPAALNIRAAGLAAATSWQAAVRLRRHDGAYRRFETRSVPIPGTDGAVYRLGMAIDVEDQLARHERLVRESTRLARIASVVPGVIYAFRMRPDGSTHFVYANPAMVDLFGLEPSSLVNDAAAVFAAMPADDARTLRESIAESARHLTPLRQQWCYRHPARGLRWMEGVSTPIRESDGSTVWHGIVTDITHQKEQETALSASEARYRELAESLPQIGWTCTPEGIDEYSSEQWLAYTGVPRGEANHGRWLEHLHPEDREAADAAWVRAVAMGAEYRARVRMRRHDGAYRWFEIRGMPLRNAEGRVIKWFGTNTDIHEEWTLREELRAAQQRFETIASVSPALIHSFRRAPDGHASFPFAPAAIKALFGFTPEQLARDASGVFERIHPADLRGVTAAMLASARDLTPWDIRFRVRHPVRGEIWVEVHTTAVRDPDGGTTWHGVLLDITERKHLEEQLQIRSDALENSMTAFAIVRDWKFVYANRTYLRLWGYDRLEEILGTSPATHALDPAMPARIVEAVRRDGQALLEFSASRRDGATFEVRMQLQRIIDPDGIETYFGTAIDITEEKQARESLQKMADAFREA